MSSTFLSGLRWGKTIALWGWELNKTKPKCFVFIGVNILFSEVSSPKNRYPELVSGSFSIFRNTNEIPDRVRYGVLFLKHFESNSGFRNTLHRSLGKRSAPRGKHLFPKIRRFIDFQPTPNSPCGRLHHLADRKKTALVLNTYNALHHKYHSLPKRSNAA